MADQAPWYPISVDISATFIGCIQNLIRKVSNKTQVSRKEFAAVSLKATTLAHPLVRSQTLPFFLLNPISQKHHSSEMF